MPRMKARRRLVRQFLQDLNARHAVYRSCQTLTHLMGFLCRCCGKVTEVSTKQSSKCQIGHDLVCSERQQAVRRLSQLAKCRTREDA